MSLQRFRLGPSIRFAVEILQRTIHTKTKTTASTSFGGAIDGKQATNENTYPLHQLATLAAAYTHLVGRLQEGLKLQLGQAEPLLRCVTHPQCYPYCDRSPVPPPPQTSMSTLPRHPNSYSSCACSRPGLMPRLLPFCTHRPRAELVAIEAVKIDLFAPAFQ